MPSGPHLLIGYQASSVQDQDHKITDLSMSDGRKLAHLGWSRSAPLPHRILLLGPFTFERPASFPHSKNRSFAADVIFHDMRDPLLLDIVFDLPR
jgi:hypothetical protein